MPGAMQTGFASAGGLSDTKLFSNAVDPAKVAKQRLFSWFDSYDIYDEAGNTIYVVTSHS